LPAVHVSGGLISKLGFVIRFGCAEILKLKKKKIRVTAVTLILKNEIIL
jgi:hypothetical protein